MPNPAISAALETIYASLHNNNEDLDNHILSLKILLRAQGETSVEIDPAKLIQPNRQGRKLMQSYFKQRGVIISFPEAAKAS